MPWDWHVRFYHVTIQWSREYRSESFVGVLIALFHLGHPVFYSGKGHQQGLGVVIIHLSLRPLDELTVRIFRKCHEHGLKVCTSLNFISESTSWCSELTSFICSETTKTTKLWISCGRCRRGRTVHFFRVVPRGRSWKLCIRLRKRILVVRCTSF